MKRIDRLKEIEKIADKLGIGTPKDVECVGCNQTFKSDTAIILTDEGVQKHLCKDCYQKVLSGELKEKTNQDELLKQLIELEKYKKQDVVKTPERIDPGTIGEFPPVIWEKRFGDDRITYTVTASKEDKTNFLALIPNEGFNNASRSN